ncbi:MAG: hypothetical protein KJ906_01260 [Nanoarchaeota archaeon]|nr:hypothetical protein [Nanoarchaeota archaeon]
MRQIQQKTKENMLLILEVLQRHGQLHIRGIQRMIEAEYNRKLNANTVNRIVEEYLLDYIQITDLIESVGVRLKFCKLNPIYVDMSRHEIVSNVVKKALDKHKMRKNIHR